MTHFGSSYSTPGWQRAQARGRGGVRRRLRRQRRILRRRRRIRGARHRHGRCRASVPLGPFQSRPSHDRAPRLPLTIEGELVAKSTGAVSDFAVGERVFHQKFGNGNVTAIDGNKLTIAFDKAGEKRVVDSFVERV